ncbi:MAG: hypothetical protein SOY42_03115 [Clostridium sp.]|nr:hypothetical protein [Clostridium sp.]
MGMESFNIMMLPENISISRNNDYWKLCGKTEIKLDVIEDDLVNMCIVTDKNNEYIFKQCIDIKVYETNKLFQGFEFRGCLSCLEEGVKACYDFYECWKEKIPLKIYVLNEEIKAKNCNDLYEVICYMYSEKIKIFKRQYGNIELKVTSGNFYNEIKKRKRWYYKIFS